MPRRRSRRRERRSVGSLAAVRLEDELSYMEPPFWYFPARHSLGAALIEGSRPAEAEAVYRRDLKKNPNNGWSLFGIEQSLRAQGKRGQAEDVRRQFQLAWIRADRTPTSSRF